MSIKHLYLIAVAAILGCASASSTPGTRAIHRKANVLTAEEIADAHADVMTAYDAVARLRPNWLAAHGVAAQGSQYAVVFFDGQQYGGIDALRNIPAYHVGDIRYYDITQAGATFGIKGDTGGVIEVRSKK
jgi:hypothetical protein